MICAIFALAIFLIGGIVGWCVANLIIDDINEALDEFDDWEL